MQILPIPLKSDVKSAEIRRYAFEMYLEGLGFRATGRILKISYGTVYHWVKKWGSNLELPKRNTTIGVVELDEMHTYVYRAKRSRYGKRFLYFGCAQHKSFVCGDKQE
jgi:transposase